MPDTAGFSVVIQLTESAVNSALSVAYRKGLFPNEFKGSLRIPWAEFQVETEASFDMRLERPTLDFNTDVMNGVGIDLSVIGTVSLDINILNLFAPTSEYRETIDIDFAAEARLITALSIEEYGPDESAVSIDFRDIRTFALKLTSIPNIPDDLQEYVRRAVQRVVRTRLHNCPGSA